VLRSLQLRRASRLFGLSSVGNGSVSHDLKHVLLMSDCRHCKGWLMRTGGFAIAGPKVGLLVPPTEPSRQSLSYTAIRRSPGEVASLETVCSRPRGPGLCDLDKDMVDVPALDGRTNVGPLASGRRSCAGGTRVRCGLRRSPGRRDGKNPDAALTGHFRRVVLIGPGSHLRISGHVRFLDQGAVGEGFRPGSRRVPPPWYT